MPRIDTLDLLAALIVTTSTGMGLIAAWVALSQRDSSVRIGILTIPLASVWMARAYEPLGYFAVEALIVVAGAQLWGARHRKTSGALANKNRRGGRQLGLRSLLLLMVLLAMILAAAAQMPRHVLPIWCNLIGAALAAALAVLMGLWVAAGSRARLVRIPLAFALSLLLSAPLVRHDMFLPWFPDMEEMLGHLPTGAATHWMAIVPAIAMTTTVMVLLARASGLCRPGRDLRTASPNRSFTASLATITLVLAAMALFTPTAVVFGRLLRHPAVPTAKYPRPIGFDVILEAGRMLINSSVLDDSELYGAAELIPELEKNRSALDRLRVGLSQPAERHLSYSKNLPTQSVSDFRQLARALAAEGRLALLQDRTDEAAISFLDIVRLGHAVDRGGLVVDWLVGRSIEAIGLFHLAQIRDRLSPQQSDLLIARLRELERHREPLTAAFQRDDAWEEVVYGWSAKVDHLLHDVLSDPGIQGGAKRVEQRSSAAIRLLILDRMITNFRQEHGRLPRSLLDIVPPDDPIAQDPFALAPAGRFRLVLTDQDYQLYSVGPDGDDDRGTPVSLRPYGEGDYTLDSLFGS